MDEAIVLTGFVSCSLGVGLMGFAWAQNKYARQLAGARRFDKLEDLRTVLHEAPLLVAVSGEAWTAAPRECEIADPGSEKAVLIDIRAVRTVEKQTPTGSWVREKQELRREQKEAKWCLQDGSRTRLPVISAFEATDLMLRLAGSKHQPPHFDWRSLLSESTKGYRDLGTSVEERVLPTGTHLTAVGQLALDHDCEGCYASAGAIRGGPGNRLVLQLRPSRGEPFLLSTRPFNEVLKQHQHYARVTKGAAAICTAVGAAILLVRTGYNIQQWWRKRSRRRQQALAAEQFRRDRVEQQRRSAGARRPQNQADQQQQQQPAEEAANITL
ncbi:hypothetical protein WJX73_004605 [Symbiochloris irregularis]|uniref:RING-type E3 ubiquitin transferase n=1 Tax=Symbiochloris irregularis TaxID=706552 RepID=A0AAW1NSW2_9CHLO